MDKSVVVLSGGQDSMTCFFKAREESHVEALVHFVYGQRHGQAEIEAVTKIADLYAIPLYTIPIANVLAIGVSALTDNHIDINDKHPHNENLPASFVPGRNLILISTAAIVAYNHEAPLIYTGVCETDYSGYPDCRRATMDALQESLQLGMEFPFQIVTPLMYLDKADTFKLAQDMGMLPFIIEHSHTCYVGDHTTFHEWGYGCGLCPACNVRSRGYLEFMKRYHGFNH